MRMIKLLLILGFAVGAWQLCFAQDHSKADRGEKAATRIFINGAIYTLDPAQPWAQALAIRDNRIIYVGGDKTALTYANEHTQVEDLGGKMMLPGFHDVHIHPLESGSDATDFDLDPEQWNAENFYDDLVTADKANPGPGWLIGYGHSLEALLNAAREPKAILDEAIGHRPVIIMEQTSHSMWLNSQALKRVGIEKVSADPPGGLIVRDDKGEPNGLLLDNAGEIAMARALSEKGRNSENDYRALVEDTLPALAKVGITSIADARTFWQLGQHKTWQRLADNQELTLRVNLGLWAYPELDDTEQLTELAKLYRFNPESLLQINQIKVYSDGILVNTTAAMLKPYNEVLFDIPGNRGLNYFSQARLTRYIQSLEPLGFDFHIHGIGDRGVHEALNAIEAGSKGQGRHRITHVEVVDKADLPRFAALNVTADAQVAGEFSQPAHWPENIPLIGKGRSKALIPIRALVEAGARLTLSSDWSVSDFNPFTGMQNAVTRAPEQISLEQAIAAYTINGAYNLRQEDRVGSIKAGKLADLIVLDRNLFKIPPNTIDQTKVILTLVDGEEVFRR
ncbi:amidohydrolase [Aliiglaciecola sp. CAU 1673]|uniref:amidohydrolase n=1 Tax=Aliiglaciecola sp. CAU 1673 TaxID=3032595 RepID=UPI0023DCD2E0|nr:amidohydrolase [Aliiglaciecola sp. CAU 1673]MDF2179801.1 amidohydrolase [Aliiglaciecola sp. CAU 1673]